MLRGTHPVSSTTTTTAAAAAGIPDRRWRVYRQISGKKNSAVYEAWDRKNGRRVIIKRCREPFDGRHEFRMLSELGNCDPGLVASLACGQLREDFEIDFSCGDAWNRFQPTDQPSNVVMEHPGATVPLSTECARRKREKGTHDDAGLAKLLKPAFRALAEVHEKSDVVHNDVKPGNIVRNARDGRCVIVDMGMSEAGETCRPTASSHGTPLYMSPEALEGRKTGAASDTWAMGIVLYQNAHDVVHPYLDVVPDLLAMNPDSFNHCYRLLRYHPNMWRNTNAPLASDLAKLILATDPAERVTAKEALEHPLFS